MKVINFLPDDYLHRQGLRRANVICALIGAGALVAIGSAVGLLGVQAIGVAHMRTVVDRKYEEAGRQIKQMKELEDRKAGLLHKVELSSSLLERVPRSFVLAKLTNNLPAHTSLTSVTMLTATVEVEQKPEPTPDSADAGDEGKASGPKDGTAKSKAAAAGGKKRAPTKIKVKRVQFTLAGLATTDVDVADYIGRLCTEPIFDDVDLKFSEEFPYKENMRMRRFEIVLRLSPKAEEMVERSLGQKAATAANVPLPRKAGGES
jgi:Tfp pilus assembly protein PilN